MLYLCSAIKQEQDNGNEERKQHEHQKHLGRILAEKYG